MSSKEGWGSTPCTPGAARVVVRATAAGTAGAGVNDEGASAWRAGRVRDRGWAQTRGGDARHAPLMQRGLCAGRGTRNGGARKGWGAQMPKASLRGGKGMYGSRAGSNERGGCTRGSPGAARIPVRATAAQEKGGGRRCRRCRCVAGKARTGSKMGSNEKGGCTRGSPDAALVLVGATAAGTVGPALMPKVLLRGWQGAYGVQGRLERESELNRCWQTGSGSCLDPANDIGKRPQREAPSAWPHEPRPKWVLMGGSTATRPTTATQRRRTGGASELGNPTEYGLYWCPGSGGVRRVVDVCAVALVGVGGGVRWPGVGNDVAGAGGVDASARILALRKRGVVEGAACTSASLSPARRRTGRRAYRCLRRRMVRGGVEPRCGAGAGGGAPGEVLHARARGCGGCGCVRLGSWGPARVRCCAVGVVCVRGRWARGWRYGRRGRRRSADGACASESSGAESGACPRGRGCRGCGDGSVCVRVVRVAVEVGADVILAGVDVDLSDAFVDGGERGRDPIEALAGALWTRLGVMEARVIEVSGYRARGSLPVYSRGGRGCTAAALDLATSGDGPAVPRAGAKSERWPSVGRLALAGGVRALRSQREWRCVRLLRAFSGACPHAAGAVQDADRAAPPSVPRILYASTPISNTTSLQ
ncbi:hypothetical protein DFH09DRAFT_1096459 [Mycena vulgaris]|nr:hypothetical protein DFH09DRAFT_1096459 [Mycena vulgaris]